MVRTQSPRVGLARAAGRLCRGDPGGLLHRPSDSRTSFIPQPNAICTVTCVAQIGREATLAWLAPDMSAVNSLQHELRQMAHLCYADFSSTDHCWTPPSKMPRPNACKKHPNWGMRRGSTGSPLPVRGRSRRTPRALPGHPTTTGTLLEREGHKRTKQNTLGFPELIARRRP